VRAIIKNLNPKEMPSYDLLINKILQKLSEMGIKYITQLCNGSSLRRGFFSPQWKVIQIIIIQKLGKSAKHAESYRSTAYCLIYQNYSRNFYSPGSP
jgi:hypothetical protein